MPKATVKPSYRIELFNASGFKTRRGRPVTLSQAKFFTLSYGKRVLAKKSPIPKEYRTVGPKKALIERAVRAFERERRQALVRRRGEARARRVGEILKRERLNVKAIRLEVSKTGHKPQGYERPPAVVGPVQITPILTKARDYTKDIVEKKLRSQRLEQYIKIQTLDFTLKEPIEATQSNYQNVIRQIRGIFKPHLEKYFRQTRGTPQFFWFRIKFNYPVMDREGKQISQNYGVSAARFQINDLNLTEGPVKVVKYLPEKAAFERFESGLEHTYDYITSKIIDNKYFERSLDKTLYIIGFTLENVVEFGKRFDPELLAEKFKETRKRRRKRLREETKRKVKAAKQKLLKKGKKRR